MKTKNKILTLMVAGLLSACGGGGGGGDTPNPVAAPTTSPATTPSTPTTPAPDAPAPESEGGADTGAQSLVIDSGFTLTSDVELTLDIKPSDLQPGSYLSVCKYSVETESTNRQECVYKGPIDEQGILEKITLAHRETALAAEVWLFIQNYQPEQYVWQYDVDLAEQTFTVR